MVEQPEERYSYKAISINLGKGLLLHWDLQIRYRDNRNFTWCYNYKSWHSDILCTAAGSAAICIDNRCESHDRMFLNLVVGQIYDPNDRLWNYEILNYPYLWYIFPLSLPESLYLKQFSQLYNDHLQNTLCTILFYKYSGEIWAIWTLRKTLWNMFYWFSSMPGNSENVMFATEWSHTDFDASRWSIFWLGLEAITLPGS